MRRSSFLVILLVLVLVSACSNRIDRKVVVESIHVLVSSPSMDEVIVLTFKGEDGVMPLSNRALFFWQPDKELKKFGFSHIIINK